MNRVKNLMRNKSSWVLLLVGLLCGLLIFQTKSLVTLKNDCIDKFELVREDPYCNVSEKKSERLDYLENSLKDSIDKYKENNKITRASVFVRDLKSTRFLTVNEQEKFVMASLLKVPLAMAAYKLAEVEPEVLNQKLTFEEKDNLYGQQYFKVSNELQINKSYSIEELISRSIIYSDNSAAQTLSKYYAPGFFTKILDALGLSTQINKENDELYVTARSYSNIFRSLYNSSYLTRKYSNEILELLAKTQFKSGALSKIPSSVRASHKFAERIFESGLKQLNECGIVYSKKGEEPYIFCIMTEGMSFDDLQKVQGDLSYTIFTSLSNLKKH